MAEPQMGINDPILAALLAELDAVSTKIRAYAVICAVAPPEALGDEKPWPDSPTHPDLLSTTEAAERAGKSNSTIERWCKNYGIGQLYGSHWRVSSWRLSERISNKSR